jgi:TfoX/Sxy family transcriptional regulator of competence genes
MASTKDYLEFVLDCLSGLDEVTYRPMMGEYIIYYKGKIIGGIYDNRFLVKPVRSAKALLPGAPLELPYEGAKEMLLVEDIEDTELMAELFNAMCDELPAPKKKKK